MTIDAHECPKCASCAFEVPEADGSTSCAVCGYETNIADLTQGIHPRYFEDEDEQ